MIINYSRNNRKKYFFQGRETTKIEDTNSSATERSREPQPKEKKLKEWLSHDKKFGTYIPEK